MSFDPLTDEEFENVLATAPSSDISPAARVLIAELYQRVLNLEAEIAEQRRT